MSGGSHPHGEVDFSEFYAAGDDEDGSVYAVDPFGVVWFWDYEVERWEFSSALQHREELLEVAKDPCERIIRIYPQ